MTGGSGAFPVRLGPDVLVPVGNTDCIAVPLIFDPGVLRWSIFLGLGLGVSPGCCCGITPVGYHPGNRSALGVYGGGILLTFTYTFQDK